MTYLITRLHNPHFLVLFSGKRMGLLKYNVNKFIGIYWHSQEI